jgi:hypothetical protein
MSENIFLVNFSALSVSQCACKTKFGSAGESIFFNCTVGYTVKSFGRSASDDVLCQLVTLAVFPHI